MEGAQPGSVGPLPPGALYLVEWWREGHQRLDHDGGWIEIDAAAAARDHALRVVRHAWTGRVRISILVSDETVAAVDAGPMELAQWDVAAAMLPVSLAGPTLPPRGAEELRDEVVCGCRDALGLALRAGLLNRSRVAELLHRIDRSFDAQIDDEA